MIYHDHQQGSEEWKAARRGVITGSRFKDARAKLKGGGMSKDCINYAKDTARERCGGTVPPKFQNAAMRTGTEQESIARLDYESHTGNMVDSVGFITDDAGIFGLSPDGLIGSDGVLEIKTLVSSDTIFTVLADGDISEYIDQCLGYLWLLGRQWVDLVLWAPDLESVGLQMTIIRIDRDESKIEALETDLLAFANLVQEYTDKLTLAASKAANADQLQQAA